LSDGRKRERTTNEGYERELEYCSLQDDRAAHKLGTSPYSVRYIRDEKWVLDPSERRASHYKIDRKEMSRN